MAAKQSLKKTVEEEKVKGFVDILVARNVVDGLSHLYVRCFSFNDKISYNRKQSFFLPFVPKFLKETTTLKCCI